jgi:hypothetical protein
MVLVSIYLYRESPLYSVAPSNPASSEETKLELPTRYN